MKYEDAIIIAERIKAELAPHCERIEIAGSIRRQKPEVKDIEIVAIPKPYDIGLFQSGIAEVINQWQKVKGEMEYGVCKYTQRILPDGIKVDIFFAEPGNWGLQLAVRTGSADYSHKVLASGWVSRGYRSEGGYLYSAGSNTRHEHYEEIDLFKRIGVDYVEPQFRNL